MDRVEQTMRARTTLEHTLAALTVCGLLALVACGGSSPQVVPQQDASTGGCTSAADCPHGQVCSGGACVAQVDASAGLPWLVVTPTVLTYTNPYVGGTYQQSFSISNAGNGLLTVSGLNLIDNTANHDFTVDAPPTPFTVVADPQQGVTITVTLKPTDNATPSGVLHVLSDDPQTNDLPVQLTANVTDNARLKVCVLQGATPADGCNTSTTDGSPLINFQTITYGGSASQVTVLTNGGGGSVAERVNAIALVKASGGPGDGGVSLDGYASKVFVLDTAGHEQNVQFPYYLNPTDPSGQVPTNELRVRVTYTDTTLEGALSGVSLQVTTDHPVNSKTSVPIIGEIYGCTPYTADGGVRPDGAADPQTDIHNCGTCGHECPVNHNSPACVAGACQTNQCDPGWGDCDSDPTTGCEQDVATDLNNCGSCGHACASTAGSFPNVAGFTCAAGACTIAACEADWFNLNDPTNPDGCECHDTGAAYHDCADAYDMSAIDDNGQSASAQANIPRINDAVWLKVTATNTHWDQEGATNPYNLKIGFTTNPNNEFKLEVATACPDTAGTHLAACGVAGDVQPIDSTMPANMFEWSASGEAACYNTPAPWTGVTVCQQHGGTYYLKVTRQTAATCNAFTIKASNGT
jgi:hypothetical protein